MPISTLQNFYKETIADAWTAGAGTFYVSTKPTPSSGILVISPSSASLRQIVRYSSTGTDGNGDYVVIASADDRGLGGTTDQAHAVGEPVRMNYTAEHQQELSDAIDQIVAAGAQDASAIVKGLSKLSVAPADAEEPIAVGTTTRAFQLQTKTTRSLEAAISVPHPRATSSSPSRKARRRSRSSPPTEPTPSRLAPKRST